ncbi:MAG: helix-turn-helix domain-containing protein [Oceanicaulis sp.]|nr:helix-turn-helix domain-containing protein [Oceanicaulis sp.]
MSEQLSMTGAEFRTYRVETLKLNQTEMAELLDVSRQTISAMERRNGQVEKIYVLAANALHHVPGAMKRAFGG